MLLPTDNSKNKYVILTSIEIWNDGKQHWLFKGYPLIEQGYPDQELVNILWESYCPHRYEVKYDRDGRFNVEIWEVEE
jgi:hypothetical protein